MTVALAGNPNSGKSTIFNALTGLRQKVGNYPGVTVEKKTGRCELPDGRWVDVIDLPGTYSLVARAPDEQITMEVLRGLRPDVPPPDVVVVVVDASNLQRNLYLVSQLIELGRPMVVALNMTDVADRRRMPVSASALSNELGVPVVPMVGHRKIGIDQLKRAITEAQIAPMPQWKLPQPMKDELLLVGGALAIQESQEGSPESEAPIHRPRTWVNRSDLDRRLDRYRAIAERMLIGDLAADIAPLMQQEPVKSLLEGARQRLERAGVDPIQADVEAHYKWIEQVAMTAGCTAPGPIELPPARTGRAPVAATRARNTTDRVDQWLLHRVWGVAIFLLIMSGLFVSIFWLADPLMSRVEEGIGFLGSLVANAFPEGPLRDLWTDGVVAGVGAVLVFVPQIAILFLFLAILEDSGYLARAAFLMDRLLGKVGLSGKSFIPLLSSFACAIPGILSTRSMENRRDRLATIFVAPFMSCSARLPVYALLIGTFFASFGALARGGILLGLYVLGIVAAVATAWVFKRTLLKGQGQAFILELPPYKRPQVAAILRTMWTNTRAFITRAGTIIFCLSVILWALMYYPRLPAERAGALDETTVAAEQLQHSYAGRFGRWIEPAIRPLGFDWKIGIGLVGAFAAREVFVSTMGIVYSVGGVEDETGPLSQAMQEDRYADGSLVWRPLVAASLLVWFVIAMQCMSTLAVVKRETQSWRWPIAMMLYMNGLAYLLSLAVYQVGCAAGW